MKKVKANSVITHEVIEVDGGAIGVKFKVKDAGEVELDLTKVSAANQRRAMVHGFVQRVSDRAAISRDTKTGASASPAEKLEAMQELVEHLNSGAESWSMGREGGGGASLDVALLVSALCEVYSEKPRDEVQAWVRKRTREERAALMGGEKLKPIVDRLRLEQSKGVDAEALLGELSAGEVSAEPKG
jgi:hypothetical protein